MTDVEAPETEIAWRRLSVRMLAVHPVREVLRAWPVLRDLQLPAALFPLRFGNDSFQPHLQAAIATDTSCVVLSLPNIGLDIDTADDLHELATRRGDKRSQVLARKLAFGREASNSEKQLIAKSAPVVVEQ